MKPSVPFGWLQNGQQVKIISVNPDKPWEALGVLTGLESSYDYQPLYSGDPLALPTPSATTKATIDVESITVKEPKPGVPKPATSKFMGYTKHNVGVLEDEFIFDQDQAQAALTNFKSSLQFTMPSVQSISMAGKKLHEASLGLSAKKPFELEKIYKHAPDGPLGSFLEDVYKKNYSDTFNISMNFEAEDPDERAISQVQGLAWATLLSKKPTVLPSGALSAVPYHSPTPKQRVTWDTDLVLNGRVLGGTQTYKPYPGLKTEPWGIGFYGYKHGSACRQAIPLTELSREWDHNTHELHVDISYHEDVMVGEW